MKRKGVVLNKKAFKDGKYCNEKAIASLQDFRETEVDGTVARFIDGYKKQRGDYKHIETIGFNL